MFRIGEKVRCVSIPNVDVFESADMFGYYSVRCLPSVGAQYIVRANSLLVVDGKIYRGIHLKEIRNDIVTVDGNILGEPFFPYEAFRLIVK